MLSQKSPKQHQEEQEIDEEDQELKTKQQQSIEIKKQFKQIQLEQQKYKNLRLKNQEIAKQSSRTIPTGVTAKLQRINKFIKRLKLINQDSQGLVSDSKALNLSRHMSEVAQSILLSKLGLKDIPTILDLTSALNQRYDDFTMQFIKALVKKYEQGEAQLEAILNKPQTENIQNCLMRRRVILKLLTQLYLCGYMNQYKKIALLFRDLIKPDIEKLSPNLFLFNLQTISFYLKIYHYQLYGWFSTQMQQILQDGGGELKKKHIILPEKRSKEIKMIFQQLYKTRAIEYFKIILRQLRQAQFLYDSNDSQNDKSKLDHIRMQFEKIKDVLDTMASVLNVTPIHNQFISQQTRLKGKNIIDIEEELGSISHFKYWPFDQKQEYKFYRKILLLKDNKQFHPAYQPDQVKKRWKRIDNQQIEKQEGQEQKQLKDEMDYLMKLLNAAENVQTIDQVSIFFYTKLNTKEHKHKLLEIFINAPKSQYNLIPFYARFIANLSFDLPKLVDKLCESLKEQLGKLKKQLLNYDAKVRNIKFLAELTKFNLIPPQEILEFFKEYADDCNGQSLDLSIKILENCGKYLKRSEQISQKFMTFLNKMWRIRNSKNIPQNQLLQLENAYFFIVPKFSIRKPRKKRPIMLEYIRHLIFERLTSEKYVEEIADLISRLPWDQQGVEDYVFKCLLKVAFTGKFTNMHVLCSLLYRINEYHTQIVQDFIYAVIEDIEQQSQNNDFEMSQHRVLVARCFGQLYTHDIISSDLLFNLMKQLLEAQIQHSPPPLFDEFGGVYQQNNFSSSPNPKQQNIIKITDGFNIRLICTILQVTHESLTSSNSQKRSLAQFIKLFESAINKQQYVSMDLQFQILDTFDLLRPSMKKFGEIHDIKSLSNQIESSIQQSSSSSSYQQQIKEHDFSTVKEINLQSVDHQDQYEFDLQLSELINDSCKQAKKDIYKSKKVIADKGNTILKSKKQTKMNKPLKRITDMINDDSGGGSDQKQDDQKQRQMILIPRQGIKTKHLAKLSVPTQSNIIVARETQIMIRTEQKRILKNDQSDEAKEGIESKTRASEDADDGDDDDELKKKTLMLAKVKFDK